MEFNKRYNRTEFVDFLQHKFLPEDFVVETTSIDIERQTKYIHAVTKLGSSEMLDLVVYEVRHNSTQDARVGLSKEAFRFLADEWESRALVLFVPENSDANYRFSLITIDLNETEEGKLQRIYSNPRRYSYYLGEGIAYYTPNKYLNNLGRVTSEKDLTERFSVEVLTKAFYQELSDWYAWAVKIIRFPNKLDDKNDDDKYNAEAAIRLVTRLIFVWFLKQKRLIPEEFFDEEYIRKNLLESFNPIVNQSLFYNAGESKYYKAILQNLFFAMLNSPITKEGEHELSERHFRNGRSDYDNNKLMRYESLFSNPQAFVDLANRTVPFLNGGLFDCLDVKDNDNYVDGFSDRKEVQKSLFVPDYLFFVKEYIVDLSHWYADKRKKEVKVNGILNILKRYNFTIEENTPFDQEVSLDPELLGKVFENLLASYNPETQTTARKQTGSFYTPRDIVQYMVDESLVAHLKHIVGEDLEAEYRKLISYVDEEDLLTDAQKQQVMEAIYHCKILDPACGSGAFPVGMLQQMVHILSKLDPTNEQWKKMMLDKAVSESRTAFQAESREEREERLKDIENSFDENLNNPDYARKLYLIENCIYGVDIQPIAIKISKLRFFISLVVDQKTTDDPVNNFGIRPLPNLEAKFVAANSLIPLVKAENNLGRTPEIIVVENKLKEANHKIFGAKTIRTKRKWRERLIELRAEMAEKLANNGFLTTDAANQLASWDMFNQNTSASFFDADWMFGIKDGFDVVIGNPPYGVSIKGDYRKAVVSALGNVPDYEIYYYFIECAKQFLCEYGILSYIIPNTWLFNTYATRYRLQIVNYWSIIEILDCTKFPIFESATVLNTIITWKKNKISECSNFIGYRNTANALSFQKLLDEPKLRFPISDLLQLNQNWGIAFSRSQDVIRLINKIRNGKLPLIDVFPEVSQGLIAYDKYRGQSTDVIANRVYHSFEYRAGLKKWLWGEDIKRYEVNWNSQEYIDYCDGIANPRQPKFFKGKRLLVREITNPSIFAAITSEELYNDPAVLIVLDNNGYYPLEIVLAIFNSKLATFYHFNHSPKATKGAFPKILILDIKQFPLPSLSDIIRDQIVSIVRKRASICDDIMLDILIYRLYNLTYDEVLIVDPETPITREEYEKEQ
ncbi:TaqI-like C-terminal specificity domain-containing protein [uncultured Parabacteroides sp.]|uniref:Eco57I restriction-modification methylase domain-containing protein n=1 Tax=uncultured Parabacteroides sp. TaxID=512312 RepID=UPI00265AA9C1|nr:TaqI-like C-terminal specificity domain-containing protein [uncultured Parabacteroides sp.]